MDGGTEYLFERASCANRQVCLFGVSAIATNSYSIPWWWCSKK